MIYTLLRPFRIVMLTIIVATLVVSPRIALPFEIGPKKKVHETLTLMATDCLNRVSREAGPLNCLASPVAVMDRKVLNDTTLDLQTLGLGEVSAKELTRAVKWADDPTKEVGIWTIFKFGVKLLGQCEKNLSGGLKDGLLCSSHHGPLQF